LSCQRRDESAKVVERRLDRLLERNRQAAKFFTIAVKENDSAVQLTWSRLEKKLAWARLSEGCYLLRSNIKEWTPEELWKAYIQLTDAEEAFRIQKDDLKLRPLWHQKQNRVQSHILVCFLVYVLWKCFGQMCKQAGLGDEPRKGVDIRLRCISTLSPTW